MKNCRHPLAVFTLLAGIVGWLTPAAFGQQPVSSDTTVTTDDGWSIPITYFKSDQGKDAGVILMVHGEGENRLLWTKYKLAMDLQSEGFAVVTVDLRKHGQAKSPRVSGNSRLTRNDWLGMASVRPEGDLETVKGFIFKEHMAGNLNMAKMGIVAVSEGAPVALAWAAGDWAKEPYQDASAVVAQTRRGQDVRAMVLVSPSEDVTGIQSHTAIRALKDAATYYAPILGKEELMPSILFLYAANGTEGRIADKLESVGANGVLEKRIFKKDYPTKFGGAKLLQQARQLNADKLIIGFLKKQVQEVNIPWEDRRSRRNRP